MRILKQYKSRKLLVMIFVSYMLLMFLTIIIGATSYISTLKTIRKSVEEYNIAMVEQARAVAEEKLLIVEKSAVELALSNTVERVRNMNSVKDPEYLFTISKLITEIRDNKTNNGFIKGIYIFFSNANIIVSDEGMFEPKQYYEETVPYESLSFEQWENLYSKEMFRGYRAIESLNYRNYKSEIVTFQQPLEFYKTEKFPGSIVVMIDNNYMNAILSKIKIDGEGAVFVLNKNNELMLMSGDKKYLKYIDYNKLNNQSTYQTKDKSENVVVTKVQSSNNGWKYVTIIPMSQYYEKAANVRSMVFIITSVQLILGAIVATIMAWKNYKPIRKSFERLKEVFGYADEIEESDFFSFVEKITSATLKENKQIKNSMSKLQPVLKTDLINQLLKGTNYEYEELKNNLHTVGINFGTNIFSVCKIHIDDCSKFAENSSIQEIALVKLVITNVITELVENRFSTYWVDIDKENLVVLFNYKNTSNIENNTNFSDRIYSDFISVIVEIQKFIGERFSIFISFGVSTIYENMEGIHTAFSEAEEALNYKMLKNASSVIQFKEIKQTEYKNIYTIQTELQLISHIKAGENEKVEKIVNEIYSKIFGTVNQSLEMAKCNYFDIVNTLIKVMDELRIEPNAVWGQERNMINELLTCKNIYDMNIKFKETSISLCNYINLNKKSHNVELKERILDFITKHYDNNSISLAWVSDELGLNSSYLSYFFKEQVGENFLNYISKLRIEKSKQLLSDTGLCLQDIAEKVGYSNSGVFIKAFKKLEGCTPGKYREASDN